MKQTPPAAGRGRKRGVPNKTTRTVREIFTLFVEHNAESAQQLYERVAKRNPAKALEILARMSEFVLPRLQRTELRLPTPAPVNTDGTLAADDAYAWLIADSAHVLPAEVPIADPVPPLAIEHQPAEVIPIIEPLGEARPLATQVENFDTDSPAPTSAATWGKLAS
jgi:hypothetical protein